ncbi:MAG: hydroxymethylglutaryl-CoA lyase [Kiritimatiellia bacterium]|jgi:hydroxymethylglutaryl-CoA lyase
MAVRIYEVSLRDGLQNEALIVPTDAKVVLAERLVAAGFRDIEFGAFVSPRYVPQMADTSELFKRLPQHDDVAWWALVPNARGLDRALDVGVGHIATFMSASETHNMKNVNRTMRESLASLRGVVATAKAEGLVVRSYISTVFGCPFEGYVDPQSTVDLALALLDAGADEVALGDTTGMGQPEQVKDIFGRLVNAGIELDRIACHFHDTQGTAIVNAYSAWQVGARSFDGSIGGIGGCPYAPGATGNCSTEDLVNLFHGIAEPTGIDLDAACAAGAFMEQALKRQLPGRYLQFWKAQQQRQARRERVSAS